MGRMGGDRYLTLISTFDSCKLGDGSKVPWAHHDLCGRYIGMKLRVLLGEVNCRYRYYRTGAVSALASEVSYCSRGLDIAFYPDSAAGGPSIARFSMGRWNELDSLLPNAAS